MITIGNTETFGWKTAVRGMRNPLNSWKSSDSTFSPKVVLGKNDLKLMRNLVKAGSDHGKFMRMIVVSCDIVAPLYWWKEMDTYKVGTVANSCSTMHKIGDKPFVRDDFSYDHMNKKSLKLLDVTIKILNRDRQEWLGENKKDKGRWWQLIQCLPTSYNQKRTWMANYGVLRNIYHARKNHKLDEWWKFCQWIEHLPYSELITMSKDRVFVCDRCEHVFDEQGLTDFKNMGETYWISGSHFLCPDCWDDLGRRPIEDIFNEKVKR